MELNKEIQEILIEFGAISQENNWTYDQKRMRSVYDTFRIQNIVENLTVTHSSTQLNEEHKTSFEDWRKENKVDRLNYNKFLDKEGNTMDFFTVEKMYKEYLKVGF